MYHRRPADAAVFTPLGGVALLFVGWATFIVTAVASERYGAHALVGLILGEVVLAAVPVVAALEGKISLRSFGLRRAPLVYLVSGLLVGSALWYVNWQVVVALDIPKDRVRVLAETVAEPPLPLAVLAMAVLPAICEELMFRGVVLRAFAGAWKAPVAVVASALLFSAYHISVPQALPTFTLGLALGALALRSGSLYPTMIAHLMNNLAAVLVTRDELPGVNDWISDHGLVALVGASAIVAVGLALLVPPPAVEPVVRRGPS
ncbi:MAG: CPBP family intramembrane metalloprotease [Deltaproteobacteria bacterium]|nr:CPBP family intramembrane metalloprotease [Deltaproteobacteria bacterium]MCW5808532.1 CPBP family intramembrane metalloprotease [Deltaproteobacteria bacterium]